MSEAKASTPRPSRQWVTLRGNSMDLRVGTGIVEELPRALKSTVGRPHGCALLHDKTAPAETVESLRQNLSDQGFDLGVAELSLSTCDLAAVAELDALLAEHHVTADDLVVVVGDLESLSVAAFACATWCGGVSLVEVPTSAPVAVAASVTPRPLDVPGAPGMLRHDGGARFSIVDVRLFDLAEAPSVLWFNIYKCGDGLKKPHFISLFPIDTPEPDFHRLESFSCASLV